MSSESKLAVVSASDAAPAALKPPVRLPAWRTASCSTASSGSASPPTRTSTRPSSSITAGRRRTRSRTSGKLLAALQGLVSRRVHRRRAARASSARRCRVRVSPYLLSLIDWSDPYDDPLRLQFIPLGVAPAARSPASSTLDSLHERADAPVPGLTHRYADKALFLALDTCPVYCRFCTRSYAVGIDTDEVEKVHAQGRTRSAGSRRSTYIALAPRARGHRHLRRRRATSCAPSRSR